MIRESPTAPPTPPRPCDSREITAADGDAPEATAIVPNPGKNACAACKKQRKRCDDNCKLSRFFTSDQKSEFQAVHRIFGVKNFVAMINRIEEEDVEGQRLARDTLVWEAQLRLNDPRYGCYSQVLYLQHENMRLKTKISELFEENQMLVKQMEFIQKQQKQKYWSGHMENVSFPNNDMIWK